MHHNISALFDSWIQINRELNPKCYDTPYLVTGYQLYAHAVGL